MTECEACKEDFAAGTKDDDLCPECLEAMNEGCTCILLGKYDCGLIFRSEDGVNGFWELILSNREDHEIVPHYETMLASIAVALKSQDFIDKVINEAVMQLLDEEGSEKCK